MLVSDRTRGFRAMGTDVRLWVPPGTPDAVLDVAEDAVRAEFEDQERRFSRFRADSELSRVNAAAGDWVEVTPAFAEVAGLAIEAARTTRGLFDPTVLGALLAAGYDRDFDDLLAGARAQLHPLAPAGRAAEIALEADRIRLPRGCGIDLGGIAKGWTVDHAAHRALAVGADWALVSAGGDLRIAGDAPVLAIDVEDPAGTSGETCLRLGLDAGAIATSSITRRSWGPGLHHLIDPRTSRPAQTGALQATALAATCAEAEVASKVLLLRGEAALADIPGVLVLADGPVVTNLPGAAAA